MSRKQIQIKNPMNQEATFEGLRNVMCTVCGQVNSNEAGALEHAWSIDNPAGMDVKDFNYCAHQMFAITCYYETVVYPDTKPYEMANFGRQNRFGDYDDILNNEGQVATDGAIRYEKSGDTMWYCNGKVSNLAVSNSKVPLVQSILN